MCVLLLSRFINFAVLPGVDSVLTDFLFELLESVQRFASFLEGRVIGGGGDLVDRGTFKNNVASAHALPKRCVNKLTRNDSNDWANLGWSARASTEEC